MKNLLNNCTELSAREVRTIEGGLILETIGMVSAAFTITYFVGY